MSKVWHSLENIQNLFTTKFEQTGIELHEPAMAAFNQPGWVNRVWTSETYRRAHIDIVDARQTKGLWMMHCCIFPHVNDTSPIFGFDVIAGKSKITGCFIDYSPTNDLDHPMSQYFAEEVSRYEWNKPRKLPAWADEIFSEDIVAAGNVSNEDELGQIASLAGILINHYLEEVGKTRNVGVDSTQEQNLYARNQKQNPHTPRVMVSLGLSEADVTAFVQNCLFPEV